MKLALLFWALVAASCASARGRGLLVVECSEAFSREELARVEEHLQRRLELGRFPVRAASVDLERRLLAFTLSDAAGPRAAELRQLVEHTGALRFVPIVEPDAALAGAEDEREGMLQWRGMYPEGSPERYHATPPEHGGPADILRWYEDCDARRPWIACSARDGLLDPALAFTERDLQSVETRSSGELELRWDPARMPALRAYSQRLPGVPFALVDDERVVVARVSDPAQDVFVLRWDCASVSLEVAEPAWNVASRAGRLAARPRVLEIR